MLLQFPQWIGVGQSVFILYDCHTNIPGASSRISGDPSEGKTAAMSDIAKAGLSPLVQEAAPLRRKIAASLRMAVQTGALEPGARLVEKDLCQELNVSRTSLREALRELEAEGLVESGQRGLVVASITPDEARNIYNVRAALEGLVAEQFAQLSGGSDQLALDRVVKCLALAYENNDFPAIISEKDRFYEVLCLGAKNMVVLDLLTRLNSRINNLRSLSRSNPARGKDSLLEIMDIAAALKRRDALAAKAAAVRHIERAAEAALGQAPNLSTGSVGHRVSL